MIKYFSRAKREERIRDSRESQIREELATLIEQQAINVRRIKQLTEIVQARETEKLTMSFLDRAKRGWS